MPSPSAVRAAPELIAEVLERFGHIHMRVLGTSMVPALRAFDIVLVNPCAIDEASPGDIILFAVGVRVFAHRVLRIDSDAHSPVIITKGDALRHADQPVRSSQLLGRVVATTRGGRVRLAPLPCSRASMAYAMLAAIGRRLAQLSGRVSIWPQPTLCASPVATTSDRSRD
jgi:signal peptidase I